MSKHLKPINVFLKIFLFACFLGLMPLGAEEKAQPKVDPTFVSRMDNEMKDLQDEVDKEFSYKLPETPEDLEKIKDGALAIAGEGWDFDEKTIMKVFWKKTYTLDYEQHQQITYFLLVVYPEGKTASYGRFDARNDNLMSPDFGPGTYLKIDGKTATCDQCMGGSFDRAEIEFDANKLLEGKSFDLEMKETVKEKIDRIRNQYEKGHRSQKRLLIYHGVFSGPRVTEARDEELQAIHKIRKLAEKNNIQIIEDRKSDEYFYTLVDENKYKNLVGGDADELWDFCKRFYKLK